MDTRTIPDTFRRWNNARQNANDVAVLARSVLEEVDVTSRAKAVRNIERHRGAAESAASGSDQG